MTHVRTYCTPAVAGEPEEGKAGLTGGVRSAPIQAVDQHFGSCASLLIYSVAPDRAELLQVTEFNVEQGHNQGKLDSRMAVIADCFVVFAPPSASRCFGSCWRPDPRHPRRQRHTDQHPDPPVATAVADG